MEGISRQGRVEQIAREREERVQKEREKRIPGYDKKVEEARRTKANRQGK